MSDSPINDGAHQQEHHAKQQAKRQRSVIYYIAILFIAAFLLLLLTSVMERREHAENLDDLNQSLSGLKDSVSAMQSVQDLYAENDKLKEELHMAQQTITAKDHENAGLEIQVEQLEKTSRAMDWFWQIDESFVRGRYKLCRELIASLQADGLQEFLPKDSITENDRFSPYDRYLEIRGKVVK